MLMKFFHSTSGRGASWTFIGFGASYAIRLLSTLVLTRLLAPEVFGLMSLAGVLLTALVMLSDVGTVPSVIRSPRGDDPDFLDTAWSVQAVRGFCLGALVLLLAWPVSRLYDEPQLFPILCALSITPMIQGLGSISVATCQRHVRLGRLTVIGMAGKILHTVLNILFAWWLESVWALVIGAILGALFSMVASYLWLPPYRPRLRFHRDVLDEIVTFGRWVLLATLFTYFGGQGAIAIMGLEVPVEVLGLITIATTIAWAFNQLVHQVLNQVAFPAVAKAYREGRDFVGVVGKFKRLVFLLVLPAFLLIAFLSQPIIDMLYDSRYAQAGTFLGLIALHGGVGTLAMPYQNAMLAAGDSRAHSIVMGFSAVATIVAMLAGSYLFGIYGMIAGWGLGGSLLPLGASIYFARRYRIVSLHLDFISIAIVLSAYAFFIRDAIAVAG